MDERSNAPRALLADQPAGVDVSSVELLAKGYRTYERHKFSTISDQVPQTRDVLRAGPVVAILPIDPARGEVVLIRQFRYAAHLANGTGDLIEIVAGRVDGGEQAAAAARRETIEEIGVPLDKIVEVFSYLPTPGITDEHVTFFAGSVDSSRLPDKAGLASEREDTRPMRVSIGEAIAAIGQGRMHSGITVVALQWLALNRERLGDILDSGTALR